jgi:hypothetical protein
MSTNTSEQIRRYPESDCLCGVDLMCPACQRLHRGYKADGRIEANGDSTPVLCWKLCDVEPHELFRQDRGILLDAYAMLARSVSVRRKKRDIEAGLERAFYVTLTYSDTGLTYWTDSAELGTAPKVKTIFAIEGDVFAEPVPLLFFKRVADVVTRAKAESLDLTLKIHGTPLHAPASDAAQTLTRHRSADTLEQDDRQELPEMLFEGFYRRGIAMLYARPDAGKSTLARDIANSLASGASLDVIVPEGPARTVMLIDFETHSERLKYDLATMRNGLPTPEHSTLARQNVHIYSKDRIEDELEERGIFDKEFLLSSDWAMDWITNEAVRIGADVIIIDTVRSGHPVDENSNPDVEAMFAKFKKLARRANAGVIALHHVGKYTDNNVKAGDSTLWMFAGCGAWQGKPDLSLHLFPTTRGEGETQGIRILPGKYKYRNTQGALRLPSERIYRIHPITRRVEHDHEYEVTTQLESRGLSEEVYDFIGANQPEDVTKGVRTKDITQALTDDDTGKGRTAIQNALAKLLDEGRIMKLSQGFYRTKESILLPG